jgi:hypothetical protein
MHTEGMVDMRELDEKLTNLYDFTPAASWLSAAENIVDAEMKRREQSVAAQGEDSFVGVLADMVGDLARSRLTGEAQLLALP